MMRPRCGTGGDRSGGLYFCRPISHHGNHLYPQSLSRSLHLALHLAHLCCLSLSLLLSCWLCLSADACSSYPLSLSLALFLFLCLRHRSGLLTSSHSLPGVTHHSSQRERSYRSCFSFFTCLIASFLCVCASIPPRPTDLEQLSNRTGSSALTITAKV